MDTGIVLEREKRHKRDIDIIQKYIDQSDDLKKIDYFGLYMQGFIRSKNDNILILRHNIVLLWIHPDDNNNIAEAKRVVYRDSLNKDGRTFIYSEIVTKFILDDNCTNQIEAQSRLLYAYIRNDGGIVDNTGIHPFKRNTLKEEYTKLGMNFNGYYNACRCVGFSTAVDTLYSVGLDKYAVEMQRLIDNYDIAGAKKLTPIISCELKRFGIDSSGRKCKTYSKNCTSAVQIEEEQHEVEKNKHGIKIKLENNIVSMAVEEVKSNTGDNAGLQECKEQMQRNWKMHLNSINRVLENLTDEEKEEAINWYINVVNGDIRKRFGDFLEELE